MAIATTTEAMAVGGGEDGGAACGLGVMIRGVAYTLRILAADPAGEESATLRLRKAGKGEPIDVTGTEYGPTCSCADFAFRHAGNESLGCKHIQSMRALGLLALACEAAGGLPEATAAIGAAGGPHASPPPARQPAEADGLVSAVGWATALPAGATPEDRALARQVLAAACAYEGTVLVPPSRRATLAGRRPTGCTDADAPEFAADPFYRRHRPDAYRGRGESDPLRP